MSKSEVAALPVALALVVCDSVYQDREGKRALVGLFNRIASRTFPAVQSQMCVYVSLASVRAESYCRLEVVNVENDAAIVSMEGTLPMSERTSVCDVVFELVDVTFDQPGIYVVRFWGGQERVLIERAIEVVLLNQSGE